MDGSPRITISVPCFGRPERTRRIIDNILNQNINNWEAFVIGDGCPHFQKMVDSGEVETFIKRAEKNGNKLNCYNLPKNYGFWGYQIATMAFQQATGNFLIFAGNDDTISNDHFEHYLSEIENTNLDLVYYNSFILPQNKIRNSILKLGGVGHSEIIIRTSLLRGMSQKPIYAADWEIINEIQSKTNKIKKADSKKMTYTVTRIGNLTSDTID